MSTLAPSLVLTLLGFLLAYQFVAPAPPKGFKLGTGDAEGAYFLFANRYRDYLLHEGIEIEVKETAGSLDNLSLLVSEGDPLDAAFVQGGTRQQDQDNGLLSSLGSLYYEPLWVFYRGTEKVRRIPDLISKRLAVGVPGSGTQMLASRVLAVNGLDETDAELFTLGGKRAVDSLLAAEVDAIFLVASAKSPAVRRLLSAPGIHLMSFERANAYTSNLRFLTNVILPEGAIDLERNIPPEETILLAATANLVVRDDLHPALIDLLLQAAQSVHEEGGWFEQVGQFPAPDHLEFPLNADARRYYKYGPPFLQRFLPFWAASWVDRMKVMLLPLLALLIPLIKVTPPIYRWRMRSKVFRWYRELQEIDLGLFHHAPAPEDHYRKELDRIEHEVAKVDIPLSYADELFNLRLHIEMIRRRLEVRNKTSVV